jgi:hypothetical protein
MVPMLIVRPVPSAKYLENGTGLSHGIKGKRQGFLFVSNKLER